MTVTNFNYGRYLARNIESILSQTFRDFELILIDNASTDESLAVMRRYESQDDRIRVIAHPTNQGMFASLRESCDVSRGRYRVHVDADDWVLTPDAFELQVALLEDHPSLAFVYSSMTMMTTDGREILATRPFEGDVIVPGEQALEAVLSFSLNHSGMMLRLEAYRAGLGYRDGVAHVADMFLAVQLCARGDVGYLDRKLYAFGQHGANLHNRPQLQVVRREVLPVIDAAFAGSLAGRLPDAQAVRRRVVRRALVHLPTQYVFSGQLRTGWRLYWESCKVHPFETIFQVRTLALIARTLLGQRGYQAIRGQRHRWPTDAMSATAKPPVRQAAQVHRREGGP